MTLDLAISLLNNANTGDEILQILNNLTQEESQQKEPTLEEIEF